MTSVCKIGFVRLRQYHYADRIDYRMEKILRLLDAVENLDRVEAIRWQGITRATCAILADAGSKKRKRLDAWRMANACWREWRRRGRQTGDAATRAIAATWREVGKIGADLLDFDRVHMLKGKDVEIGTEIRAQEKARRVARNARKS